MITGQSHGFLYNFVIMEKVLRRKPMAAALFCLPAETKPIH